MRYLLLISFIALALMTGKKALADSPSYDENLPRNWYVMPEDMDREEEATYSSRYQDLTKKQNQGIDRVLHANNIAFNKMEEKFPSRNRTKWKLEACILDVTLSASGVVGALVAKGQGSAALYYRKSQTDRNAPREEAAEEAMDMTIPSDVTYDDLDARIEPLVKAVMATGQIENEKSLRENLKDQVFDMHTIIQFMTKTQNTRWNTTRLRVDLQIDISGKINPVTTLGGGVKIRLEWLLNPGRTSSLAHIPRARLEKNRKIGDGLKKIAENLVQQMQEVKYDDMAVSGYDLNEVKFGLGLFGEGNVGVVKLGGSLFGYLYLTPNTFFREGMRPEFTRTYDSVPLIDYTSNEKWASWAESHGIAMEHTQTRDGRKANVYATPAERLRQGLVKTVAMAGKMAERAHRTPGAWEIYKIKAEFQLSLSGDTGLFKLGGTGVLELVFSLI